MTTFKTIVIDGNERSEFDASRLDAYLEAVLSEFPELDTTRYKERIFRSVQRRREIKAENITEMLIRNALDEIETTAPDWTHVASQFYSKQLHKDVVARRGVPTYAETVEVLVEQDVYKKELFDSYTKAELQMASGWIDHSKDNLFTYIGLLTLDSRYLAKTPDFKTLELPQERFMTIALTLMVQEPVAKRMELVKEAYWALSSLYMTVATPTLANAGKTHGQLSSCFVDIMDDSLRSIYDSNTDVATLSKSGGGIGVYIGKIRSKGSDIRGFKGVASGIVGWAKGLNNTAVSVDQLGQRQGSIAVYYEIHGKDIFRFLDLRLNNGDERDRAHDLFLGVCVPDLFMEKVEAREKWYLFDPHEVRTKKGWSLEDYFDEEEGRGSYRDKYQELVDDPNISKDEVEAIDIMKAIMKSQLETGVPYMFYRDTVNRANPNKHLGMIYCSNLCTEIMQNLSVTTIKEEILDGDKIIIQKQVGDFVTCNLSSINLGRAVIDDVLERLIPIQVRMLDNTIDVNNIEVLQAQATNKKYRAVGLGTFGLAHLLALKGIKWESQEAVDYNDNLYEKIAFLTINASVDLAIEKGAYPAFEGSEWHTGEYFKRRGYTDAKWTGLSVDVATHGLRNGYLMAVAPNGSTSVIAGSTASIDPIFNLKYSEEKKDYKIPVVVPDLNPRTRFYYKGAYFIDQKWTLRQNAARQRHIDQAQSCNLYVAPDIKAKELLDLHMTAWKLKIKSTYYVRSQAVVIDDNNCEWCQG